MDPNNRVQVLDCPVMSPGYCVLCGSTGGDHRKFIDFGKEIDFFGNVYFCSFCIVQVMEAIEFIPVANFERLHDSYRELNIRHDKTLEELKSVKDALANLLRSDSDNTYGHPADNPGFGSDHPTESVSDNVGVSEPATVGDSEAEQSTSSEGDDDLFDASDFDQD